jgi:hypothetical protein
MEVKNGVDALFFGCIDEPTGVDDDNIGLGVVIRDLILFKTAEHYFTVNKVFGTAETDQV